MYITRYKINNAVNKLKKYLLDIKKNKKINYIKLRISYVDQKILI